MKPLKTVIVTALLMGLSACADNSPVSRNEPLATQLVEPAQVASFTVEDVRISVPRTLVVSEANGYFPNADIVWHGDAYGARHQQIEAIFEEAMTRGVKALHGNRSIYVDVEVKRFHSLTQRARYTTGGVHSIKFTMALRDVQTGALVSQPRLIKADLKAFGGTKAIANDHRGLTQKVRIMDHLAVLIQREVTREQSAARPLPQVAAE